MFGWRGRIGIVIPRAFDYASEFEQILQQVKGVAIAVTCLNLERHGPKDFEKIFPLYQQAGEYLAKFNVNIIILQGTIVFTYKGYEKGLEIAKLIEKNTGVPTRLQLTNQLDALKWFGTKRIALASYYDESRNQERKTLLENLGFQVLSMKGTSAPHAMDIGRTIPYAAYRAAKEAFLEAPEADAIYISGPGWEVVEHIDALEKDTGKPVVASTPADIWAAFNVMRVRQPIEGYGRLLEELPPLP